jgi:hypothetical protein
MMSGAAGQASRRSVRVALVCGDGLTVHEWLRF